MKTTISFRWTGIIPAKPRKEKPINFSGALKDFEEGQLCYVVARRYKGKGPVRLLLHEAKACGKDSFGYGHMRCWIVSPGTLMGSATSDRKAEAARKNGKKGGRPRKLLRK
jgi:hypothetical protein